MAQKKQVQDDTPTYRDIKKQEKKKSKYHNCISKALKNGTSYKQAQNECSALGRTVYKIARKTGVVKEPRFLPGEKEYRMKKREKSRRTKAKR